MRTFLIETAQAAGNFGSALDEVKTTGGAASLGGFSSASTVFGNAIALALATVGLIFFALAVYAGFIWMTAQGEDDKIAKAKKILQGSIVGVFIVIMAYAATALVSSRYGSSSRLNGGPGDPQSEATCCMYTGPGGQMILELDAEEEYCQSIMESDADAEWIASDDICVSSF